MHATNLSRFSSFSYVPGARWDPVTPFGMGSGLPGRGGGRPGRQHGWVSTLLFI